MKTKAASNPEFKAWRDIEPPSDFTQNVMRRIRTQPAREPRWRELVASFLAGRLAFGASLAVALAVATAALRSGPVVRDTASLQPDSLIVAYAKMSGGR